MGVIVSTGVTDMWLLPVLVSFRLVHKNSTGHSSVFGYLRMLRLSRVLKIVGMFLHADLSWAEGPTFQLFIMSVIAFNSVLMGFESALPDFFLWYYVEQVLLAIFTFEILLRV